MEPLGELGDRLGRELLLGQALVLVMLAHHARVRDGPGLGGRGRRGRVTIRGRHGNIIPYDKRRIPLRPGKPGWEIRCLATAPPIAR
ncbi:hypothetical protein KCMC57_up28650 [Kitasatospora sp. CMC57]|uniref:Uncharacterized protein n=1 Tax=Kitasatospora sp. CMC57 TaxID=3231513 RepID=A0AB33JWW6_9ACTN